MSGDCVARSEDGRKQSREHFSKRARELQKALTSGSADRKPVCSLSRSSAQFSGLPCICAVSSSRARLSRLLIVTIAQSHIQRLSL